MIVRYVISEEGGEILLDETLSRRPFKITPAQEHPTLKLGDYFRTIRAFLTEKNGGSLRRLLSEKLNNPVDSEAVKRVVIRSEKHGAMSHVASAQVFTAKTSLKLAVVTAVTFEGKDVITREFDIINDLNGHMEASYLPEVYAIDEIQIENGGQDETMVMMLCEWFEGYHEWHLSYENQKKGICVWDQENGHRFASRDECEEIFKQASKILTLYYDSQKYFQIYPWHHAAGDFVVRTSGPQTRVRLTTARGYEPLMTFLAEERINPLVAMVYFFLNLTLKMRLDKEKGTGDVIWADEVVLIPVVDGFFEGLEIKEKQGRYGLGAIEEFSHLLKSFTPAELKKMLRSLLDLHSGGDPQDFLVIRDHLSHHAAQLHQALQNFHG